jgi:uncharacterized protein (TIGR02588 family)
MTRALEKNALEWTVFGVGLILVMATLAYLAREVVTTGSRPPEVVVELGTPRPVAHGFQVPVTVVNRGDRVAEGISVTITLVAKAEREEAVLNIAFLPHQSRREGWVTFRGDPKEGDLQVGPVVYASP